MNIEHISSKDNAIVKKIRKASRGNTEYFLLENEKLIREAFVSGIKGQVFAVSLIYLEKHLELVKLAQFEGCRVITLAESVFSGISSTVTHQGCMALFDQRFVNRDDFPNQGVFVVCDAIQDPGNMGAIIRSSLGFSVAGAILMPGCANPFNSKTIRASAGACLHVPMMKMDYDQLSAFLWDTGTKAFALDAAADKTIDKAEYNANCAIIVGNEGSGITDETRIMVDELLRIPTDERLESLNAAVSLSLVLYEFAVRKK